MRHVILSWLAIASAALLGACGSPIVGAECRDGFASCDGVCVDLASDPDHCGACQESCGAFTCEDSECTPTPRPDGGDGDGDGDRDGGGSGGRDAGESPIGTGNPFDPDASFNFPDPDAGGCAIGTTLCGNRCVDTNRESRHCGGCFIRCADDQFCVLGVCTDACEQPLELCRGSCVDYETDPSNCGRCGRICRSGICEDGACADAVAGNVIVIGHDFAATPPPAINTLVFNALERARGTPIRTLLYQSEASAAAVNGVRNALERGSQNRRRWEEVTATTSELTFVLFAVDALVIPPLDNANDARLIELGQMWSVALAQFVARGGVILVFDTRTTRNAGTHQILEPSGLFGAAGRGPVPNGTLLSVDVTAGITGLVPPSYPASSNTVALDGVSTPGDVVVRTPDDRPVVVHRVIAP